MKTASRRISLRELVSAAEYELSQRGYGHRRVRSLLCEIMECETRVSVKNADTLKFGLINAPALARDTIRRSVHTIDLIGNTLAGQEYHGPNEGRLGLCSKKHDISNYRTPGLFCFTCSCPQRSVQKLFFMAKHESPGFVHQGVWQSYDVPPETLIYDDVSIIRAHYIDYR